jgi:hypothetical protein
MRLKEYFEVNEFFTYFFRKKDPNRPTNFSLKAMHGVNKLSMLIFLVCIAVMFYRYFIR